MLRDYNNYQRDDANWNRAYAAQSAMQEMQTQSHNDNLRKHQEMKKFGFGDPSTRGSIESMYQQVTPMEHMANQHQMNMMNAASHAMNNEMAQVQDRKMDLADNEQGRKNLETEYSRNLEAEKIRAAERMNNRNNQGLEGLMDGMNTAFSGVSPENMQVPNYDLYSNNGNRMGGSYFGKALLG